jgi:hypothetical protein
MERVRSASLWLCMATALACGDGSSNTSNGLYINAALGATLVQDGGLKATVVVTRDDARGAQVAAALTVNGVEVPQQTLAGVVLGYDFSKVSIPDATGGTLRLHASFASDSADLTLHCPDQVTITAPAEQSRAAVGDSVTVSWRGEVDYATPIKPDILVRGFDPASGSESSLALADRSVKGKSSDTFALPDLQGAPQWMVELFVPGDLVDDAAGMGFCMLERRIHIVSK